MATLGIKGLTQYTYRTNLPTLFMLNQLM